jgi:DNA-binding NarL/FixJ family response regulator
MRLVLCDDHRILIESLAVALQARGHDVRAAATTPEECVRAVAEHHPDVCLLDLYLPERENGLQAAQVIRRSHPDTLILIMSGVADPLILSRAIDIGVAGIVRKDQTVDKIEAALQQVVGGESVFQTGLVRDIVRHLASEPSKEPWHYLTAPGRRGAPPARRRRKHQADVAVDVHRGQHGSDLCAERTNQARRTLTIGGCCDRSTGSTSRRVSR